MKTTNLFIILLVVCSGSCDTTQPGEESIQYKVKVDSIQLPGSVNLGDTVIVRFYGTIASDGCSSFDRFQDLLSDHSVDIMVWARRTRASTCPAVMVSLDGRQYSFVPAIRGQFTLTIRQPDGSTLQHFVHVF